MCSKKITHTTTTTSSSCMYVYVYVVIKSSRLGVNPSMIANPARGQLMRENGNFPLSSTFALENLWSREL